MFSEQTILKKKKEFVVQNIGNEHILVPLENDSNSMNKIFVLNETGLFIWELIDGKNTIDEIINKIYIEFKIDNTTIQSDVYSFLQKANEYIVPI